MGAERSRPLKFLPGAEEDASRTADEMRAESEEFADRFEAEIERTLSFIEGNPLLYQEHEGGTHRAVVRTFRDSIIYRIYDDVVLIVAVARPGREPGYWAHR